MEKEKRIDNLEASILMALTYLRKLDTESAIEELEEIIMAGYPETCNKLQDTEIAYK